MTTEDTGGRRAPPAVAREWQCPFAVGQVLETPIVFTPDSVRAFARLTNDTNPLHHDFEIAAATRFGGLIASGTQTIGLLLGSLANHIPSGNASLGLNCSFRLRTAVPADASLMARWTVRSIQPKQSLSGVLLELHGDLVGEKGTVFVDASLTIALMPYEALQRPRPA